MTFPHIIATGEAGHGKDTIGAYLIAHHGYVRTAFADPLKREVVQSYGATKHPNLLGLMHDPAKKETPILELALVNCLDAKFVEISMREFQGEDQLLFKVLKGLSANDPMIKTLMDDPSVESLVSNVYNSPVGSKQALDIMSGLSMLSILLGSRYSSVTQAIDEVQAPCGSQFNASTRLELARSPRRLCQLWGTEYRRNQLDTYWIDKAAEFIKNSSQPVVICDGRFPNETEWANAQGLRRMHAFRPEHIQVGAKHASEQIPAADANTAVIINDRRDDNFASFNQKVEAALVSFQTEPSLQKRHKLVA